METTDRQAIYERVLFDHVIGPWFPRCIDHRQGGFLSGFDAAWNPVDDGPKFLEFQARQTLTAAELNIAYPSLGVAADAANHGFEFLRDVMWDGEYGGWFVYADSGRHARPCDAKHVHGMAYAVSACLAVHRMSGRGDALALACEALEWIELHAHDDVHGGYHSLLRRDGTLVRDTDDDCPATDHIGTPVGTRDLNVHGDLMEAFAYASSMVDDARIDARFDELAGIVLHCMSAGEWPPCQFFDRTWQPVPTLARPPTGLQNASRLLQVRNVRGESPVFEAAAFSVIDRVFRHAWCEAFEAPWMDYPLNRPLTAFERAEVPWWGIFEALRALEYRLALEPGDERTAARRDRVLQSVLENYVDPAEGGIFYWSRKSIEDEAGGIAREQRLRYACKGNAWKDASHDARALLHVLALEAGTDAIGPLIGRLGRPLPAGWTPGAGGAVKVTD